LCRMSLDTAYYAMRYYATRSIVMADPTLLLLSSLADGQKHGYAIMTDIQTFAGIELGPGTLYGAITRLEERGFIQRVVSEDRRQPYRLTLSGKAYLEEELSGLRTIVQTGLRRLRKI
jgi:DNA-binding PadR family transcriptional regulator